MYCTMNRGVVEIAGLGQGFAAAIPALVGAAATLASTGAQVALQMKSEKTAKASASRLRKQATADAKQAQKDALELARAQGSPISAVMGGGNPFASLPSWAPLAAAGAAALGLVLFMRRKK